MDKAILKTLAYADIFKFPMKAWEIQKWLIKQPASLTQVEKSLKRLIKQSKVGTKKGFYYLNTKSNLVNTRLNREKHSQKLSRRLPVFIQIIKLWPWLKLVGVSGTLSMNNASIDDDIDLVIITEQNRLWLTRLFVLLVLESLGRRRTRADKKRQAAGKICPNIFLEISDLAQSDKSLYIAHEVLQLKLLWQKDNTYDLFLEANQWALKYLPNWIGPRLIKPPRFKKKQLPLNRWTIFFDYLENLAKRYQLYVMDRPTGAERISQTSLYLHPEDYHPKVMQQYRKNTDKIGL